MSNAAVPEYRNDRPALAMPGSPSRLVCGIEEVNAFP